MNTIEFIRYALSDEEVLCQLAEEAAELAQAALKLRRAMSKTNPTPVPIEQAKRDLIEELADVRLCAEVLNMGTSIQNGIDGIAVYKMERWAKRLKERQEREIPVPLTEEQLRGMIGEPVWCVYDGGAQWFIVGESLFTIINGMTAYRCKPEEVKA